LRVDAVGIAQSECMVKFFWQLFLLIGYKDPSLCAETFCGCNLMVVASLAKMRAARQNDNLLAEFQR